VHDFVGSGCESTKISALGHFGVGANTVSGFAGQARLRLQHESQGQLLGYAPTESWFNSFKNERYHGLHYATHADMSCQL
jgi:hypothetical protein